jgi:hypothetical protein
MKLQPGKIILGVGVFILSLLVPNLSRAQTAAATLSSLAPGDDAVSASAQQQVPANQPPASPPANLPNAPSSTTTSPSLGDLGFSPNQTQGSAQEQALLNKRTHMLKVHQTLGLITLAPMVATLVASGGAKTKHGSTPGTYIEPSTANLDWHVALGGLTGGMYAATAYYSIFAPKVPGVKRKGAIRLHRDLEWVHGPGMVLTGVLGIMAYQQENDGEKVHGIASAHGAVADVTVAAYAASLVSVSWPIHLKFWESR